MKTNKLLPDSSISKVWENFRKMNGIVIEFLASNWVSQNNGTFTNTFYYEGFTSDDILEVDLYDDGTLTETQISEYDGYITEFNVENGKIVAIATTKPTQSIKILARGEIVGEKVVVNGGGSSDISASNVSCLDKDGQVSNVQKELNEQNKNLIASDNLQFRFATDGEGNYGYLKADDSFVPFSSNSTIFIPIDYAIAHWQTSYTFDASSYNNGKDITKAKVYPIFKNVNYSFNNAGQSAFNYTITTTSDWKIKYTSNGYQEGVSIVFNFLGFIIIW